MMTSAHADGGGKSLSIIVFMIFAVTDIVLVLSLSFQAFSISVAVSHAN
jgi:hypothetical protein